MLSLHIITDGPTDYRPVSQVKNNGQVIPAMIDFKVSQIAYPLGTGAIGLKTTFQ